MTWLYVIIAVAVIAGLIGYFSSNDGQRGEGAAQAALGGVIGCGYVLLQIFLWGLGIFIVIKLFGWLFG